MYSGKNGVNTADPIDDLIKNGYFLLPDVFSVDQAAPLGLLIAGAMAQYPQGESFARSFYLTPDSLPNVPIEADEQGNRIAGGVFRSTGFSNMNAYRGLALHIFRCVQAGEKVQRGNFFEADPRSDYIYAMCEEFARLCVQVDLDSLFTLPESEESFLVPLFNHYLPGADVLGKPRFLGEHVDDLDDNVAVCFQLWPNESPWRIARLRQDLPRNPNEANLVQPLGSIVALDNFNDTDRSSPFHNPIVLEEGRVSVTLLCTGEYREKFYEWARGFAAQHGYATAPTVSLDLAEAIERLDDPLGLSTGPRIVRFM